MNVMMNWKHTLLFVWVMLSLSLTAFAAEAARFGMTISTEVALFASAEARSAPIESYPRGTWMEIQGEADGFLKVKAPDGKTGLIPSEWIEEPSPRELVLGLVRNPEENGLLNLRAEPRFDAAILGQYPNGVPCELLALAKGWYHVNVDGRLGYFREEYIKQVFLSGSSNVATVIGPSDTLVNLRDGPGLEWNSIGQFHLGTFVMTIMEGTDWWFVATTDGRHGYMSAAYLRAGVHTGYLDLPPANENAALWTAIVRNPEPEQVLNLRQTPSVTAASLGQYPNGAEVTVLAQGQEWCKVRSSTGIVGYMMTVYLDLNGLPEAPVMTVRHPEQTYVNLRSLPSAAIGSVLSRVPHGAAVTVLIPGDDWIKVSWDGKIGYMSAYFLR